MRRSVVWKQWKYRRARFAELHRRGMSKDLAAQTAASAHGPWRLSNSPALSIALPNASHRHPTPTFSTIRPSPSKSVTTSLVILQPRGALSNVLSMEDSKIVAVEACGFGTWQGGIVLQ